MTQRRERAKLLAKLAVKTMTLWIVEADKRYDGERSGKWDGLHRVSEVKKKQVKKI